MGAVAGSPARRRTGRGLVRRRCAVCAPTRVQGYRQPGSQARAARAAGRLPNELYVSRAGRDRLRALGGGEVIVDLHIEVRESEAPASNVIGALPGSDPALAGEWVAIGCHLDHLGVQLGLVHPGADDDRVGHGRRARPRRGVRPAGATAEAQPAVPGLLRRGTRTDRLEALRHQAVRAARGDRRATAVGHDRSRRGQRARPPRRTATRCT